MNLAAHHQRARVHMTWLVLLSSGVVLVVLLTLLLVQPVERDSAPLVVHCAAGLSAPVAAIARAYEKEFGTSIQISYGPSGTLLANIEVAKAGDLYLPADESYVRLAQERKLVAETLTLARMRALLVVRRGNPKKLQSLADLERPEVVLAQANPDAAAIGNVVRTALQRVGAWERLQNRTKVFAATVVEVANGIKLGTVDAGFVWDGMLPAYPDLEPVPVDVLTNAQADISVGVLRSSRQPAAALRFARYMQAPEKGFQEWKRQGYDAVPGDAWAFTPQIRLFSGAMLRPAIEETIRGFEQREGVQVTRVYNGCGILVSQMKAGENPDAYFSCDRSFMAQVVDLFLQPEDISMNHLVIAVPAGNPRTLTALADLARPGLRLGLGHPQKSALGALTLSALVQAGLYHAIKPNIAVESPTGDFLVNQLRTGALDATIVYLSNTINARQDIQTIPVNTSSAVAIQPIAIGRNSPHKLLLQRLVQTIKSADSKSRFQSFGFDWQAH